MKTLYIRIVITFILISIISSILALAFSNVYYFEKLRGYNEQKILKIGKEIRALYEQMPNLDLDNYLSHIANMGFQIYAVNSQLQGTFYGDPFKHQQFEKENIRRVLEGETYHGVLEEHHLLMATGFFENSIRNSVGLPVKVNGQTYALFIRPNLEQQIGEVRILLAVLLGLTFLFSLVLIVILTRYIVKPLKKLTEATNKIVSGDYDIEMDISRQDEIGNLSRHFTHMAHSLKQLDDMRQEFVANVSHEIQSPLTSIQGFAQAISNKEVTPEEEEQYLQIIEEESRRLSSLSKQLLTLAALDKEVGAMKRVAFRLDEQIRQVLIVTEWQWTEKQLSVELSLSDIVINADPQLLYQVWLNLVTNSIKFSHSGGVIRIEAFVEQDIIVKISDTGIGIPESELPHIFERFYKADKARNRSRSGSGLGLSIAKKIIALHDGSIEVQSEFGKGTIFTVRLPRL
ncbi:sensor histidine kinase [Aneurinibacillus aneurinilyticus]|jgi:signal transduction histidine kinase|uniref:sensor histidine kinase n=1 Tax=Aneurinibacillus aneurinilyticus TaxID=1391 RepID=UPI0023F6DA6B|nr:HAMP domain-containing sensor histidine kinase [Aneurinibacillus aneurinilyticus]MCI1696289.1 HAMP domain-containing histidine kinase [Aneurinibacillus aneurinilyticus]